MYYAEINQFKSARQFLKRAERILKEVGDKYELSEVYSLLAELNITRKKLNTALDYAEKVLSLAKETGTKKHEILALRALGMLYSAHYSINRRQKILKAKSQGRSVEREDGTPLLVSKAIAYLKQSLCLAKKQNMELELAKSLYELGGILKDSGKIVEADEYLKEATIIFRKTGAKLWLKKSKNYRF